MRVLFCSQAAHTGGGVEAWMETLTAELLAREVEVFTALARGHFHDPERYAARHRVSNPIEVDGSLGFREVRVANLIRVFEQVRPDVIIPVNLEDALLAASYWKTRGSLARLAVCIHGQAEDRIQQVQNVEPFIDLAVSVSRRVTDQLRSIVGNRARHIPMGVPAPLAPPLVRDHLSRLGLVGRLSQHEKRVFDAVELMKELRDSGVTLHIAGSGSDENSLRDSMRDLPVTFHGSLSRDALYDTFYPSLDGLVIFSEAEAGPIVAWEAMVHGVVPIVSDYIGRAEEGVIRDRETGVVFPVGDMNAAAEKIRALTMPGALSSLSRAAAESLPSAYTLPAFGSSWYDALQEVARAPMHAGPPARVPSLVSPGRLSRLNLGVAAMARLRRIFGRQFVHDDPGAEWPH